MMMIIIVGTSQSVKDYILSICIREKKGRRQETNSRKFVIVYLLLSDLEQQN